MLHTNNHKHLILWIFLPIFVSVFFVSITNSFSQKNELSTSTFSDSTKTVSSKKIISYFTVSYPLGLGITVAFRPISNVAIGAGIGVGIPIPYISAPGVLGNMGASFGIGTADKLDNQYAISLWYTHLFESYGGSTVSLLFGEMPSSNLNFKWDVGVQIFDRKGSIIGLRLGSFAILPAFALSLRLH